jgi:hypothetical protein
MLHLGVIFLRGQLQQQFQFLDLIPPGLPAPDYLLELTMLFMDFGSHLGVIPEIGGQGLLFQPLQFLFFVIQVKDAPSRPAFFPSFPEAFVWILRHPFLLT